MRFCICLLASLVAISSSREVVNMACFLYHQNTIKETVCINKNLKSKKCNGKCFLVKKLKQDQPSKDQAIPPLDSKNSFEFFMPEHVWIENNLLDLFLKPNFNYLAPPSVAFANESFRPPDVCG